VASVLTVRCWSAGTIRVSHLHASQRIQFPFEFFILLDELLMLGGQFLSLGNYPSHLLDDFVGTTLHGVDLMLPEGKRAPVHDRGNVGATVTTPQSIPSLGRESECFGLSGDRAVETLVLPGKRARSL
jgi:hypothetical protein